jgi:hypothetical protein
MNLRVPSNARNLEPVSFSRRTALHGVIRTNFINDKEGHILRPLNLSATLNVFFETLNADVTE